MKFLKSEPYSAMFQSGIYFCFIVAAQQASLAHGISIQGAVPPVHAGVHNGQFFHTQNGINNVHNAAVGSGSTSSSGANVNHHLFHTHNDGINNVHNAAVGSGSTSSSGANVNHHLFHTHNDGINNVHNASVSSGSTSALGANVNHHHHHANILAPVDLKKAGEFADYFGLKPAVSNFAGQHLNNGVNANNFVHTHLNNNINVPIGSQTNKQSSQSLLAHVSRFDHEKEAAQVLAQAARNGENLNLASGRLSVTWESHSSVTIELGGSTKTIVYGERITPAELAAANQKLNESGNQTLVLNAQGEAVGGTLNLTATTMPYFNLVIPKGVEVNVIGSTLSHPLDVLGAVKDYGTLDFVSSKGSTGIADLNAGKLFVGSTGVITDLGTLDVSSKSLFNNEGMITAGTLNLNTGSGVFTNTGTITATTGNVTFTAPVAQNLVLNNTAGTIQANNGAINVRGSNYTGTANMTLSGGNYLSQTLNLNDGGGTLNVNVGRVTGLVNETALNAHTIVASSDLKLGDLKINGDPLFYNLSGNLTLSSGTYSGQPFAAVASGNIFADPNSMISTSDNSPSSSGSGSIVMISGAQFSIDTSGNAVITGGTANGGSIQIGNLDASSSTSYGGLVALIAFGGAGAGSGAVTFNSINVAGGPVQHEFADGSVYIFAGASSGTTSIDSSNGGIAHITATGALYGGGNVILAAATPNLHSTSIMIDPSGNLLQANISPGLGQSPGIANISVKASRSINLDTGTASNMSLLLTSSSGDPTNAIFINSNSINNGSYNIPGWTGSFNYSGFIDAGLSPIVIYDAGGQSVSITGGYIPCSGITVYAPVYSTFNTGITLTGPFSNYGVWVNGNQEGSNISLPAGQSVTNDYIANTGGSVVNITPTGLASVNIIAGPSSSTWGTNINGFSFYPTLLLSSLDLTSKVVQNTINALISNGTPGVSGSITALVINVSVAPTAVSLSSLTGLSIPVGDSITFTGFGSGSSPIDINLPSSGSISQALIQGSLIFSNGGNSIAQLNINASSGPALSLTNSGVISSDKQLTLTSSGIQNYGVIKASNSLSVTSTSGGITGIGSFQSPNISLTATGSNVGADPGATTPLIVNSGGIGGLNLVLSGNLINVQDANLEAVNLGTSNIATSFALSANGSITVSNNVGSGTCTTASLTTTGSNFIEDAGSGSYGVTASAVTLVTPSGQIGTPGFRVNCTSLAVNTTGNVHVSNSGTATLAINASSGNSLAITSNGTMDINGNVTGSTSVTLQTAAGSNGNIIIAANVGTYGANTTTTLVTDGSGNIADVGPGTNVVQAHLLNIASTTGNIGSPGLRTIADEINCTTGGNVHLNNIGTGPVTFLSVTGGGSFFEVLANSTITVTQPIFAPNTMLLSVVSGNGSIIINGPVGTTSSSTSVSVEGTGSITTGTGGAIFGSTVIVNNPFGNIGSSTTPLSIAGNNVSVNAVNGLVNVANSIGGAVTLGNVPGNVVGAGKSFAFSTTGTGPLTVYSVTSGNGNLSIVNNVGGMSVAAGATLSSTNGNITLQDTDTVNGSIAFGANVTVHASATADGVGKVYAVIGAIPNNPVVGNKPAHVTVNNTDGGITYFGTNSITATGSNTLNASGRNIVFNTGLLPASTISLGGGVTITADPPVVSNGSAAVSITSSPEPSNSLSNNFATIPFTVDGQSQSTANNFATATNTSVQALINTTGADSPDRRLNRTTTVEN